MLHFQANHFVQHTVAILIMHSVADLGGEGGFKISMEPPLKINAHRISFMSGCTLMLAYSRSRNGGKLLRHFI